MDERDIPIAEYFSSAASVAATVTLAGCSPTSAASSVTTRSPEPPPTTPAAAFTRLMEGNKRWVSGELRHPDRDPDRRQVRGREAEALRGDPLLHQLPGAARTPLRHRAG